MLTNMEKPIIIVSALLGTLFAATLFVVQPAPESLGAKPINDAELLAQLELEQGKFANACNFAQIINGAVVDGKEVNVDLPPTLSVDVYGGGLDPCGYIIRYESETAYITKVYGQPMISIPKIASTTP